MRALDFQGFLRGGWELRVVVNGIEAMTPTNYDNYLPIIVTS
jgi:hypothetical protein